VEGGRRRPIKGQVKLDAVIAIVLKDFAIFLGRSGWRGKENDCVNLFAHRFLSKRIRPIDRIGIEVAVPQIGGKRRKQAVRKDLVIWRRGCQTTWGKDWKAEAVPQAILEWKVKRGPGVRATISTRDRGWLRAFKSKHRGFIGICVAVAFGPRPEMKWEFV